ncbi:MAG: sugar porter family MFS transporter [Bacteroidota bacterium]
MGQNIAYNKSYIYAISLISAMGGLLFGYDWVVIGGAKPFYELYFGISTIPALQGWAMSCALVGCLLGAVISGMLNNRYGLKKLLILAAFIFIISSIGTGISNSLYQFVMWRIFGGVSIGLASNLSPMYIAEVSPAEYRGKFVTINQLTIVIGILIAQITNWLIAKPVPTDFSTVEILNSWNGQTGWRWMFWATAVPSSLFFILMFLVPESPRWLVKNNKLKEAEKVLVKIYSSLYAASEIENISKSLLSTQEQSKTKILLSSGIKKVLLIGITLAVFQQWCGINVIFNYAQEIFETAGYGVSDILFNIVITGSVNLVFTFVALYTVDLVGRRKLMLTGAGGLAIIYSIVGTLYFFKITGFLLLLLVVTAIAFYAMSLAPVTWVILSEIFPNKIRSTAMAISTFALWSACFILTYTFPILNDLLKSYGTFWLYGFICISGFLFIFIKLPETKGKSLEAIEKEIVG